MNILDAINNTNVKEVARFAFLKELMKNSSLSEMLALLLILIFCVFLLKFIFKYRKDSTDGSKKDSRKNLFRLLGSLLVIALTLISNNGINYFLGIIVLATLVTETEFLEKIVTIILGSDKLSEKN